MKINGLKLAALALTVCCYVNAFSADYFDPLFRMAKIKGNVWVLRPGETEPILAKEDFRYPFGSKIIVEGVNPKLPKDVVQKNETMVVFANDYQIKLSMGTIITTEKINPENGDAKVVVGIEKGLVSTYITRSDVKTGDAAEDAKIVSKINSLVFKTALAEATGLVDRNEIRVTTDADGVVKSKYKIESGSISLSGPQFKVIKTRRKTVFDIVGDAEFSRISVVSGEITANIDRGEDTPYQGSFKQDSQIKLWRMYTKVQKKLAVSVLITMPNGKVERYEYIENPSSALKALLGKDVEIDSNDAETSTEETTEESLGDEFAAGETSLGDDLGGDTSSEEVSTDLTEEETTDDFFDGEDDFFSDESWDF